MEPRVLVSKLEIWGFRGIRHGVIPLQKFTTLIGPNNCGKTTITEALALVLGRDRLVRALTEHDFHGSNPGPTDRILIVATIVGFEPNDPGRHADWFRWGRGVIKWQDAQTGAVRVNREDPTDRLACQIAFSARFDHDSLEAVTIRYFYDAAVEIDPFEEDAAIVPIPVDLIRQIGFFLISANRTWDRMISFGSELFRRVVSYVGGKPAVAVLAERERLRAPPNALEADENLRDLIGQVNGDIAALLGRNSELKLRVTSTDSEGILESIIPHFSESGGIALPSRRQGSGLISLQTLILLMRFGRVRVERGDSFMMVIEEPELHVPPPLQRKLVRLIQSMATQTIITTHSPTVAAIPEPHEIALVVNGGGDLTVRPFLKKPLTRDAPNPIRALFLSDRDATANALMHPTVLIPEGKTDANWLRLFVKCIELKVGNGNEELSRFAHEVGVVPTKDARIVDVYNHLREVHPSLLCLMDGDQAGDDYTAAACGLPHPPRTIFRWPQGWEIENVVGWIVSADPAVLAAEELVDVGIPQTANDLVISLADNPRMKADEIVHALLVDAIAESDACCARIRHLLRLIADIAMRRVPAGEFARREAHANCTTTIWTFNDAIQGI